MTETPKHHYIGNLDYLAAIVHDIAKEKGFWDSEVDIDFVLSKLALVHSEVSETLEAVRKEKGSKEIVTEMADIIIRLLDLYEGMVATGWIAADDSLNNIFIQKCEMNRERPYLHGVLA